MFDGFSGSFTPSFGTCPRHSTSLPGQLPPGTALPRRRGFAAIVHIAQAVIRRQSTIGSNAARMEAHLPIPNGGGKASAPE